MHHPWIAAIDRAPISDTTRKQYAASLCTFLNFAGGPGNLERLVSRPRESLELLEGQYSNYQTRKSFVAAVKALFKYVPGVGRAYPDAKPAWHDAFKSIDKCILDHVATAEPTHRELVNWVTWEDVLAKQRELATMSYGSTEHLLLSMYSLIEPLRADYGNVKLVRRLLDESTTTGNFASLPPATPRLVLNEYKTSARYGRFERDLPPALVDVIQKSLELHPRDHLFVDESGAPYVRTNSYIKFANRILEKLFAKKFTMRLLRHSFVSGLDFNESTPGELMKHSKNMLHSMTQQQLYRRKIPELRITLAGSQNNPPPRRLPPPQAATHRPHVPTPRKQPTKLTHVWI